MCFEFSCLVCRFLFNWNENIYNTSLLAGKVHRIVTSFENLIEYLPSKALLPKGTSPCALIKCCAVLGILVISIWLAFTKRVIHLNVEIKKKMKLVKARVSINISSPGRVGEKPIVLTTAREIVYMYMS